MPSIRDHLQREDPLTQETAMFLADYNEEDDRVDYKQTIDLNSEKDWLEITKDISAFANTFGGYLVFGINNAEKKVVGLPRNIADTIKDVNNLHQKINSHLEPHIIELRAKEFKINDLSIVIVYIPQSASVTHMINKDGIFNHQSGKPKTLLHKGTIYVRRSGGNHLVDSRDLCDLIERRIDQFRDALSNKIAKVIQSPAISDVYILSKDKGDKESKRFIIEDSPDSIAIKGMSFTITPQTNEETIAAWSSLSGGKSESLPSPLVLWRWYADRSEINVSEKHRLAIFQFSLWSQVPVFYWIKDIKATRIIEVLIQTVSNRPNNDGVTESLIVASFLGRGVYSRVLSLLGKYKDRLSPSMKKFPQSVPRLAFGTLQRGKLEKDPEFRKKKLAELNSITSSVKITGNIPALHERWDAAKLDCFLFASDDKYK